MLFSIVYNMKILNSAPLACLNQKFLGSTSLFALNRNFGLSVPWPCIGFQQKAKRHSL